jgi:phosphohistidine phosphatase SixA
MMFWLGWLGFLVLLPGEISPKAPSHWWAAQYDYQPSATLGQDLRRGGYVIYFRHALTDHSVRDRDIRNNLDNCSAQRNLSEAGKQQAQAIGQALQTAQIPIGRVFASPYCRTLDTARLAFGRVEVEPALLAIFYDRTLGDVRVAALLQLLSTLPPPGKNTILIGHGVNLAAAAEIDLPEGGAVVVQPRGENRFTLVAIVPAEAWVEQLSR